MKLKREVVEAWLAARRAEGMWVDKCQSCGSWFAQPRMGRKGILCDRRVCILAHRWQRKYGRMPPDWLWAKWRAIYGEAQQYTPRSSLRLDAA
jgi:hypothetical protein